MTNTITYLIGVDGGGTGTRVSIAHRDGMEFARGNAGASGLRNGADFAWNSIMQAITAAFDSVQQAVPALDRIAIGLGLAGVHNKQWAELFAKKNPGFAQLRLETDAYTTLLGAHEGRPGAIVAIGTGSAGESVSADGTRLEVGGWGFPCGDEAGGAWLGLRAVNHLQQVMDGRAGVSAFSAALLQHCGGDQSALFNWLAEANQGRYAQIAPLVVEHARDDPNSIAAQIMQLAGAEIVGIALALDRTLTLPIALCGGLAQSFVPYLPRSLMDRVVASHGDSMAGALLMIKKSIESTPT